MENNEEGSSSTSPLVGGTSNKPESNSAVDKGSNKEEKKLDGELPQSQVIQETTAKKINGNNEDNDEDVQSAGNNINEEQSEANVMRTEVAVAIKDAAQPTAEEVKEFESFSSKYYQYSDLILIVNFRAFSKAGYQS